MALRLRGNKYARKAGMWAYEKSYNDLTIHSLLKLFLEAYFDITICCMIQLVAFGENDPNSTNSELFAGSNMISSVLAIVYLVFIITFPSYFGYKIVTNFTMLEDKRNKTKFRFMLQDSRIATKATSLYNIFFLARRFGTVIVLVFFEFWPFMQCVMLVVLSSVNFGYLAISKPMRKKMSNRVELFNEFSILAFSHLILNIQNIDIPPHLKKWFGGLMIFFAAANILVNLVNTFSGTIINIYESFQDKKSQKQVEKLLDRRNTLRQNVMKLIPNEFKNFEKQVNFYNSVKFCKDWVPQRRLLINNDIDITSMEEEINY